MQARSELADHRFDLAFKCFGIEGLDNVIVHARLFGGNHIVGFGLSRHHDEGCLLQLQVGAHFFEQFIAGHRLHIPVGDHQTIAFVAQFGERHRAVCGFIDIVKTNLLEQIVNNPQHCFIVIDDQHRHRQINSHVIHPYQIWLHLRLEGADIFIRAGL